jgi:hypothetical protein
MESRSFAFVVDGDVFMTMEFNDQSPYYLLFCNTLAGNPTIVETTQLLIDPRNGWTWDGLTFSAPEQE